jgi:uncharacterized protein HemY
VNALLVGLVAFLVVFTLVLTIGTLVVRWNANQRRRRDRRYLEQLRRRQDDERRARRERLRVRPRPAGHGGRPQSLPVTRAAARAEHIEVVE